VAGKVVKGRHPSVDGDIRALAASGDVTIPARWGAKLPEREPIALEGSPLSATILADRR
jgi:hypothetical protein